LRAKRLFSRSKQSRCQGSVGGIPQGKLNGGLLRIIFNGNDSLSQAGSPERSTTDEHENVYQILDNVTKIAGSHALKAGVSFQNIRFSTLQPQFSSGEYNYNGNGTANLTGGGSTVSNTGNSIAAFLLDRQSWLIDADSGLGSLLGQLSAPASVLEYRALKEFRNRFLAQVNTAPKDIEATNRIFCGMRKQNWDAWWPSSLHGQTRLRSFVVKLFLSGNGTVIFSNAFVQWACSEALHRAPAAAGRGALWPARQTQNHHRHRHFRESKKDQRQARCRRP
jgi:hypothetical protein